MIDTESVFVHLLAVCYSHHLPLPYRITSLSDTAVLSGQKPNRKLKRIISLLIAALDDDDNGNDVTVMM